MPTSLADYRMISPIGPLATRAWLAEPPAALGADPPVVVAELPGVDEAAWPQVRTRLTELADIRSAHLPRLLASGRGVGDEPAAWLVRDRAHAQPLAALADDGRRFLLVLAGAARGAHDLHEGGWAHGDIRLTTILVDGDEGLLDLPALAASALPPAVGRVTDPASLDGFEPDRLWGVGPTRASDVYALGAAAHRVLSGRPLHPELASDQPVTGVQRVLVERPQIDPDLPGPLAEIVRACLEPDPRNRPPSAAALADRLEEVAGQ